MEYQLGQNHNHFIFEICFEKKKKERKLKTHEQNLFGVLDGLIG